MESKPIQLLCSNGTIEVTFEPPLNAGRQSELDATLATIKSVEHVITILEQLAADWDLSATIKPHKHGSAVV